MASQQQKISNIKSTNASIPDKNIYKLPPGMRWIAAKKAAKMMAVVVGVFFVTWPMINYVRYNMESLDYAGGQEEMAQYIEKQYGRKEQKS